MLFACLGKHQARNVQLSLVGRRHRSHASNGSSLLRQRFLRIEGHGLVMARGLQEPGLTAALRAMSASVHKAGRRLVSRLPGHKALSGWPGQDQHHCHSTEHGAVIYSHLRVFNLGLL